MPDWGNQVDVVGMVIPDQRASDRSIRVGQRCPWSRHDQLENSGPLPTENVAITMGQRHPNVGAAARESVHPSISSWASPEPLQIPGSSPGPRFGPSQVEAFTDLIPPRLQRFQSAGPGEQ
jgi:hypothetical protein